MGTYIGSKNTNCLTYTPKNVNLTLDPLNVTVVGSPTINNGVASGFSSSNWLRLPKIFNPSSNAWEMVIKAKTPSAFSKRNWLTGGGNASGKDFDFVSMGLENNGKPLMYITSNGTSWDIANGVASSNTLAVNTDYLFRCQFTGTQYIYSTSVDNGSTWTTQITINSTAKIFIPTTAQAIGTTCYQANAPEFWTGSIDLPNSYIKINGSTWWKGGTGRLTLKKGSKVYVPNGFDAVRYYKYTYATWTQPVLTADGVLGGDDFAVFCDSPNNTSYPAYYAFDSSTSTFAVTHEADYIIYNKNPINITKIDMTVRGSSYNYRGGTLYGSNDNSSWKEIIALSALTNGSWDISSNTGYYKYYKFSGSAGDWQPKTLTLTATQQTGSVESSADDYDYTVGNGQALFDEVVIENDLSYTEKADTTCLLYYSPNKKSILRRGAGSLTGYSGLEANKVTNGAYYATDTNFLYSVTSSGEEKISLPLAMIASTAAGGITSIDQIFDWCGYIGSTTFVLPGVKFLAPSGFNVDGTYKSEEWESKDVSIQTVTTSYSNQPLVIQNVKSSYYVNFLGEFTTAPAVQQYRGYYNKTENKNYFASTTDKWEQRFFVPCALTSRTTNGVVTSLKPYTAQKTTTFIPIEAVYNGSTSIGFIYNGSTLVWQHNPYPVGTVLANTQVAGSITLYPGVYELKISGAGGEGGGVAVYWGNQYHSGGSGACWEGTFKYSGSPATLSWTTGTGAGASVVVSIGGVTQVTAGGGATGSGATGGTGGVLTVESVFSSKIVSTTNASNGNNGAGTSVNWGSSSSPITAAPSSLGWGVGAASNNSGRTEGGFYLKRID